VSFQEKKRKRGPFRREDRSNRHMGDSLERNWGTRERFKNKGRNVRVTRGLKSRSGGKTDPCKVSKRKKRRGKGGGGEEGFAKGTGTNWDK